MIQQPTITLNNGVKMPMVALVFSKFLTQMFVKKLSKKPSKQATV